MHSSIPKEDRKTSEVLKVRRSTKYLELYEALFKKFSAATSRGHIVNFSWLWSKPESSNWTLIQKSKSNIMFLSTFCRKKNWEWGQNKETGENTRKKWKHHWKKGTQRSEKSPFEQDRKTLVMIRNRGAVNLHKG